MEALLFTQRTYIDACISKYLRVSVTGRLKKKHL